MRNLQIQRKGLNHGFSHGPETHVGFGRRAQGWQNGHCDCHPNLGQLGARKVAWSADPGTPGLALASRNAPRHGFGAHPGASVAHDNIGVRRCPREQVIARDGGLSAGHAAYAEYLRRGEAMVQLGCPLSDHPPADTEEAMFFERGVCGTRL